MRKLNSPKPTLRNLKGLAPLDQPQPIPSKERLAIPCAFHQGEKITNFCKDQNCLLPLCPKCIKIHSDEHAKLGVFSTFHPIEECLEEAHESYLSWFTAVSRLQKTSVDI